MHGPPDAVAAAFSGLAEGYARALRTVLDGPRGWMPKNRRRSHQQAVVGFVVEAIGERGPTPGWLADERMTGRDAPDQVAESVVVDDEFDPTKRDDSRKRELRDIAVRQGQPAFRAGLLVAYDRRCSVTGCDAEPALEGAHILPYRGDHSNSVTNGLLLRADIHTLFDQGLLAVDPERLVVELAPSLHGTAYGALHGTALRVPASDHLRPNREAIRRHRETCNF